MINLFAAILVSVQFYGAFWNCRGCSLEYQSLDASHNIIDSGVITTGNTDPLVKKGFVYTPAIMQVTENPYRIIFRECYEDSGHCTRWVDLWLLHNGGTPLQPEI